MGYSKTPLTRKALLGNQFDIKIKNVKVSELNLICIMEEVDDLSSRKQLPNFFGNQRFGSDRPVNHLAGKALIQGKFKEAIKLILSNFSVNDDIDEYKVLIKELPIGNDIEYILLKNLIEHPKNYVRAIKNLPLYFQRFLVSSYQSYIFNKTLSLSILNDEFIDQIYDNDFFSYYSKEGISLEVNRFSRLIPQRLNQQILMIPIVGYSFRNKNDRFSSLIDDLLKDDDISTKDFYSREIPAISTEGTFRPAPLLVNSFQWKVLDKNVINVKFNLNRGSYATVFLREIMKK